MSIPKLSIIAVFYNMQREAPRTLFTLSTKYQQYMLEEDYEVLVIDNGSDVPLEASFIKTFGSNFYLLRFESCPSPARAINQAVLQAKAPLVMICVDGARMLSPGILYYTLTAFKAFKSPVVATVAYHLGPDIQNISITKGYNQLVEDQLLENLSWQENGYNLFNECVLAASSGKGWLQPLGESNCLTLTKQLFMLLQGFDETFCSPGGGYVNLDFYKRACDATSDLIILLGEGTFHQVHGGVATNSHPEKRASHFFHEEYIKIKGYPYTPPGKKHVFFGQVSAESLPFLLESVQLALPIHTLEKI